MQHFSEQKNNAVVLVHSSLHATTDAITAAGKRPGKLFVCLFVFLSLPGEGPKEITSWVPRPFRQQCAQAQTRSHGTLLFVSNNNKDHNNRNLPRKKNQEEKISTQRSCAGSVSSYFSKHLCVWRRVSQWTLHSCVPRAQAHPSAREGKVFGDFEASRHQPSLGENWGRLGKRSLGYCFSSTLIFYLSESGTGRVFKVSLK